MTTDSVHSRAAHGDGQAFAQLAAAHFTLAEEGSEPAVIALAKASAYGRLAAMKGGRDELVTFLYLLEQHSHALRDAGLNVMADQAQGEAVALAEHMADLGDEEMASRVVSAAADLSPEVLLIARELRGLLESK